MRVKNVTLEDLRQPPYRATVDFDKVYLSPATRAEVRRETYVAHVAFVMDDHVDNARIPINPLGLTITYFREDQAFVDGSDVAVEPGDSTRRGLRPTNRGVHMPFIPRQVKPPARLAITCKVPEETATLLKRYAEFLDSTQEYVVNETLCVAFRRDKEFQAWLCFETVSGATDRARGPSPHAGTNAEAPRRS